MRKLPAICLLAALGCAHRPPPAAPAPLRGRAVIPATWPLRARPVTAPHAMVVSAHPLATQAGVDILKQGGNAIDAAVAVAFALEVVLPDAGNIGGGGFIVHRTAGGEVTALDYREAAPAAATHDMYIDSAGNPTKQSEVGHLAAGVPGSVAGLYEAWKKYGSLPWATVIAPTIRLAQGHVIDTARSREIRSDRELLAHFPASRAQFLVHDSAPAPGTMWRQPDLARTLQLISDSGPDVFYRGQIADLIVAEMQRGGGLITKDDLRRYRPKWRTPIQLSYRGYTIYSMPPASSGGVHAPPHGGHAPRLHGSQPVSRRSRLREHAARAAALEVVCRRAARPDRPAARDAHPPADGRRRRGDAHDALFDRGHRRRRG